MTTQGLGKGSQGLGAGAGGTGNLEARCGDSWMWMGPSFRWGWEGHSKGSAECGRPSLRPGRWGGPGSLSGRARSLQAMEGKPQEPGWGVLGECDCTGGADRREKCPQGRRPQRGGPQDGLHLVASPFLQGGCWNWRGLEVAGGVGLGTQGCEPEGGGAESGEAFRSRFFPGSPVVGCFP